MLDYLKDHLPRLNDVLSFGSQTARGTGSVFQQVGNYFFPSVIMPVCQSADTLCQLTNGALKLEDYLPESAMDTLSWCQENALLIAGTSAAVLGAGLYYRFCRTTPKPAPSKTLNFDPSYSSFAGVDEKEQTHEENTPSYEY